MSASHMSAFERFRQGERAAAAEVADEYAPSLYQVATAIAGPVLAEGLVVDALARGLEDAERFDPAADDERRWFIEILRGLALAARPAGKAKKGRGRAALPVSPRSAFLEAVELDRVGEALEGLDSNQRRVVGLAYLHGLSPKEIGMRLSLPEDVARGRLRAGLLGVQDALSAGAEIEP